MVDVGLELETCEIWVERVAIGSLAVSIVVLVARVCSVLMSNEMTLMFYPSRFTFYLQSPTIIDICYATGGPQSHEAAESRFTCSLERVAATMDWWSMRPFPCTSSLQTWSTIYNGRPKGLGLRRLIMMVQNISTIPTWDELCCLQGPMSHYFLIMCRSSDMYYNVF